MNFIVFLLIFAIVVFIVHKILLLFKFPKVSAIAVFTGAVKTGKSGVSFACARSKYKMVHFFWRLHSLIRKIFRKTPIEEPLFYCNIPVAGIKYYDLRLEHIMRTARFNYGSVVWIDEASLLADCYLAKSNNPNLQIDLLKFFKLFGHETHGGYCILNSQSMSDLATAIRKCTNQYFYIHSTFSLRILPISICKMREERFCEDGTSLNVYKDDVEDSLKMVLFRKKIFKMYDRFSYSILTDNLPVINIEYFNKIGSNLKADKITSFRQEFVDMFKNLKIKKGEKK